MKKSKTMGHLFMSLITIFVFLSSCSVSEHPASQRGMSGQTGEEQKGLTIANTTGRRYALVIGNSDYNSAPLRNPQNDASDMANILQKFEFSVTQKVNVTHQEMENAIREFSQEVRPGDTALFYFSGHGLQVDGINYLLPIGLDVNSADEIKYKAVNANMVLDKLEYAGSRVNIIILDSCRNNPFKRFRSLQRGLAMMTAPSGTLIAYATAPGSVAYDGDDRNSPYTKHLLQAMQTPGLDIEKVFKSVRVAVMAEMDNKQVPWESSSLTGDFYFVHTIPNSSSTPPPTIPLESTINALWNDSGDNSYIAFWLYEKPGHCPTIRENPPIVFAPSKDNKAGDSALNIRVSKLRYCFELYPKKSSNNRNQCKEGSISYHYLSATNQYEGTYHLKMRDGSVKKGNFVAEYCPPEE